jgi:hypothetical protein
MSASKYHADPCDKPSISSGIAKLLLERPPLWAWSAHPKLNPKFKKPEPKAAFDIGHAAHAMLLEGGKGITVCDYDNWITKAAKEERDMARFQGFTPVLIADFERTAEMAAIAAEMLKTIGADVSKTSNEVTMIAQIDGATCRTRPDILAGNLIIDYKTTGKPLDQFAKQACSFGYDLQSAMYLDVAKAIEEPCEWLFLVQETAAPYPCQIFRPTREFLEVGKRKFKEALAIWKNCIETGCWPGYPKDVQLLDAMPWDLNDLTTEAEERLLQEFDK